MTLKVMLMRMNVGICIYKIYITIMTSTISLQRPVLEAEAFKNDER